VTVMASIDVAVAVAVAIAGAIAIAVAVIVAVPLNHRTHFSSRISFIRFVKLQSFVKGYNNNNKIS